MVSSIQIPKLSWLPRHINLSAAPCLCQSASGLFDEINVEIQYRKISKGQIIFCRRPAWRLFLLSQGYVRIEQYDSTDTFSYIDYVRKTVFSPIDVFWWTLPLYNSLVSIMNISHSIDLFEEYSKRVWNSIRSEAAVWKSWNFRWDCAMS